MGQETDDFMLVMILEDIWLFLKSSFWYSDMLHHTPYIYIENYKYMIKKKSERISQWKCIYHENATTLVWGYGRFTHWWTECKMSGMAGNK